jgi:myo-inositol 2-dehydrogenase / D-chiro-inositol 1-dehydrogenase
VSRKLNLGLIGAGRIGRVHAETIAFRTPEANLAAVADPNLVAARDLAGRCGVAHAVADPEELLDNPAIDAVLICSSTDTHSDLIVKAARARKHIFCEKPIDHSLDKIDGALAEVRRAGVKLQIGFNRRFDANFERVQRAIAGGEIGTAHLLHIISRDPGPPPISYIKVSGGMFLDMTIHDFDMARFLIGSEVREVFTAADVRVDPAIGAAGDVDTAVIVLRFMNGTIGVIDNCRKAPFGYDQRVEVLGSNGAAASGNCYPNQVVISTSESVRRDLPLNFFVERYLDSYGKELRAFVAAVLNDTATPVTGMDGRAPVVMALAARKSYEEHRPVELKELSATADAVDAATF